MRIVLWLRRGLAAAAIAVAVVGGAVISPVGAVAGDSIYSYALDGSSAVVANGAAANGGVALNLTGDWSASAGGVHFAGDTVSQQSVGWAKPAQGKTLNVPANASVGSGIRFTYQEPVGGTCFTDSANLTQIGRAGTGLSQVKLQLSNCGTSASQVFVQCRVAGASSPSSVAPKTSTQALVNGAIYIAICVKAPDPASGDASLEIRLTRLDPSGPVTTTNTFPVARTGQIQSSAYLSVANKYALPAIANNTDQFVGDVSKVAYCQASTAAAVGDCLAAELP